MHLKFILGVFYFKKVPKQYNLIELTLKITHPFEEQKVKRLNII